ncbi:D-lyxose/D-mannose family sugar isomerase [Cellulosilyticum sp. I15G10I2]|uniref:D-lyxose/D-mannose family sugar isomerase n=1 Tax=Cellulosilyticum sp. I15G10I2 TaxID=1892843 RepID=UPI00085CC462|nr:D-lyxose/D-mannose family sugar isomerase [Cellulosilyticum sp. I15G10I2]
MKRTEINKAIQEAKKAIKNINFCLPHFAYWEIEEWRKRKEEIDRIKEVMLGWDVTDFGSDDFKHVGAVLFTIRNGSLYNPGIGVPYCEKVIVFNDEHKQVIPLHFHNNKTEDIINRGNGIMEIELFNATRDGKVDYNSQVEVYMDGIKYIVEPGQIIEITPGNSISLTPRLYHRFGVKRGKGNVVVGEVSKINDDYTDNVFANEQKRFSYIEENEPAICPLCNEYDKL